VSEVGNAFVPDAIDAVDAVIDATKIFLATFNAVLDSTLTTSDAVLNGVDALVDDLDVVDADEECVDGVDGQRVVLDGVEETNHVWVSWKKLVPRRNRCKPQEQKVPDDVLVVDGSVQTGHYVIDAQLLLGVLQQRDKGSLAAVRQLVLGHHDVEAVLPEHRLPLTPDPAHPGGGERELDRLVTRRAIRLDLAKSGGVGCTIFDLVRGISVYPRASALWEIPTCAGDIKPATEAPR